MFLDVAIPAPEGIFSGSYGYGFIVIGIMCAVIIGLTIFFILRNRK